MRRAFTLIEMLVAITIIAIMIAMLLPAVKKAKRQAKFTLCATQQKQIMTALQTYTYDFNDYWAPGTWGTPTMINAGSEIIPRLQSGSMFDTDLDPGTDRGDPALRLMRCPEWEDRVGSVHEWPVYSAIGFPGSYGTDQMNMTYNYVGGHGHGAGISHGGIWWHGWVAYDSGTWNRYNDPGGLGPMWHSTSRLRQSENGVLTDRMWLDPAVTGGSNIHYPLNHADGTGWSIAINHIRGADSGTVGGNVGMADGHVEWRWEHALKERVQVYSLYRPYICY